MLLLVFVVALWLGIGTLQWENIMMKCYCIHCRLLQNILIIWTGKNLQQAPLDRHRSLTYLQNENSNTSPLKHSSQSLSEETLELSMLELWSSSLELDPPTSITNSTVRLLIYCLLLQLHDSLMDLLVLFALSFKVIINVMFLTKNSWQTACGMRGNFYLCGTRDIHKYVITQKHAIKSIRLHSIVSAALPGARWTWTDYRTNHEGVAIVSCSVNYLSYEFMTPPINNSDAATFVK